MVVARAAMNAGMGPYTFNFLQHGVGIVLLLVVREPLKNMTLSLIAGDISTVEETRPAIAAGDAGGTEGTTTTGTTAFYDKWFCYQSFRSNPHAELLMLGMLCAVPNFIASSLNQLGLVTVEAGKSAFLTSMYVIFTPLIQFTCFSDKSTITTMTWVSAAISLVGSYLLAGGWDSTNLLDTLSIGELVIIAGAVFWAVGILMIDYSVERVDSIDLTCAMMCISTLFCMVLAVVLEPEGIAEVWSSVVFPLVTLRDYSVLLIVVTGTIEAVAYLLDTIGQINVSGSRAALLMSLDAVVAVVVAFVSLGEVLTWSEVVGCVLLLLSTCIATAAEEEEESGDSSLNSADRLVSLNNFPYDPIADKQGDDRHDVLPELPHFSAGASGHRGHDAFARRGGRPLLLAHFASPLHRCRTHSCDSRHHLTQTGSHHEGEEGGEDGAHSSSAVSIEMPSYHNYDSMASSASPLSQSLPHMCL